jgi:hypothetical protein
MRAAQRYRVTVPIGALDGRGKGEPIYCTVEELAILAGLSMIGIRARIKRGVEGDDLIKPVVSQTITKEESHIRAKLRGMARAKYKRTCPNCGHCFDIFQPAHILKTIKPGL